MFYIIKYLIKVDQLSELNGLYHDVWAVNNRFYFRRKKIYVDRFIFMP